MSLRELDDPALLKALWNERDADLSVFDDGFHDERSDAGLRRPFERAGAETGRAESVRPRPGTGHYTVVTATHDVPLAVARDGERRICGLWLHPAIVRHVTLRHALDALRTDGTTMSWLLRRNGERVDGHEADRALAVGSVASASRRSRRSSRCSPRRSSSG